MQTQEVRDPRVDHANHIGGVGEDQGGIPIVAVLTFMMFATVLFAIGFLFFTAPSARYDSNQGLTGTYRNGSYPLVDKSVVPEQRSVERTLDENPMSRTGTVSGPVRK